MDSKYKAKALKGYVKDSGGHVKFGLKLATVLIAATGRPRDKKQPSTPMPVDGVLELMETYGVPEEEDLGDKQPQLHFWLSMSLLFIMGALLALHILFISDSLAGFATRTEISEEFVGLIMLPILGLDSTLLHLDNKYDSETVADTTLGLGLQTILFMTPLMVP